MVSVYLDIYIGNKEEYLQAQAQYDATRALLTKSASIYGLPVIPSELSEEQRDILREIDVHISVRKDQTIE